MEKPTEYNIAFLANELKVFGRKDILVNVNNAATLPNAGFENTIFLEQNLEVNKIYKNALHHFKESGAHVFCISAGVLIWNWKGQICESPILICPSQIKFQKIKRNYQLNFDPEDSFLNPFLVLEFQKLFDFEWPKLSFLETDWQQLTTDLVALGFAISITTDFHYGNFHHHRFSILRDLEYLEKGEEYSQPLNEILQIKPPKIEQKGLFSNHFLFPSNNDQSEVFIKSEVSNLVVQGPPGTGKSQVITNFIGKNLFHKKSTLVVSEKRVALAVLKKKLAPLALDKYCFLPSNDSHAKSLLSQLKESWLFLESCEMKQPFQLNLSQQKIDALQFKLNLLSKEDIVGGIRFSQFEELARNYDLSSINYVSNSATISDYLVVHSEIDTIYHTNLNAFLKFIPYQMLTVERMKNLELNLKTLEKKHIALSKNFHLEKKSDLYDLMKKASFAQLLSNENQKDYFRIFKPNSSERKKFIQLSKKYFSLKKELEIASAEKKNWKILPTKLETITLLEVAKKSSILRKIRLISRMKKLLESTFVPTQTVLENWLKYIEIEEKFLEIEKQLLEIGVYNANEIDWVKGIIQQIDLETWQHYSKADSQENKLLANSNNAIQSFYYDLKTYVKMADEEFFYKLFSLSKSHFLAVVEKQKILYSFSESLYLQIGQNSSKQNLEKEILKSAWVNFIAQFPGFAKFNWHTFSEDLNDIIELQNQEFKDFSVAIVLQIKANFDALNSLLNSSSKKLNAEEKLQKAKLKRGRALLVKEFAKTRSHPTVRELVASDAQEWIKTLLPIWLVNPAQVADFFPLQRDLFDFVLFDEATQIPFVNSLGALFRAKKTIVVGDEQQMTPAYFFKTGESEPLDLLHQARFTWPKTMLKHHYRSQNPVLIAFSNRNFYNNELIAYPSANCAPNPIELHFISAGKFVNRENIQEAKAVVKSIEIALTKKESLGIVAFSESQLACIYNFLSPSFQQLLEERIEQNSCFFRALENIQGDECDHLIISLGYGPNEAGKLLLKFGPLTRKTGRRRLNVLFSRAKKRIAFFTSIQSSDLTLSGNDSLNLLRQFLQSVEKDSEATKIDFPHHLDVVISDSGQIEKQAVKIENIVDKIVDANELITLHRVLLERNWAIEYT